MRSLSLLFPASLLVLAAGAGAQQLPYPQPDALNTVQVRAPAKAYWVRPDDARRIGGDYELSNGWVLRVKTAPEYIDATIDQQAPLRLHAVARNRFVSRDGSISMVFAEGVSGDDMTMRYRPDPALAQVVVLSSRVAQR